MKYKREHCNNSVEKMQLLLFVAIMIISSSRMKCHIFPDIRDIYRFPLAINEEEISSDFSVASLIFVVRQSLSSQMQRWRGKDINNILHVTYKKCGIFMENGKKIRRLTIRKSRWKFLERIMMKKISEAVQDWLEGFIILCLMLQHDLLLQFLLVELFSRFTAKFVLQNFNAMLIVIFCLLFSYYFIIILRKIWFFG